MDFNNISFLTKLTTTIQVTAIILIFLGGILQASRFYLDGKVRSLKAESDEAEKKKTDETISNLEETVSQQEEQIGLQSGEIEEQKSRLAAVESETEPRRISNEAAAILRAELSKNQGESIEITCTMGDQEAFSFASDLKKLFESSGWSVNGVNQAVYTKPIRGLILVMKKRSHESKAEHLFNLLKTAGFHSTGEMNEKASNDLAIVVGAKE